MKALPKVKFFLSSTLLLNTPIPKMFKLERLLRSRSPALLVNPSSVVLPKMVSRQRTRSWLLTFLMI